MKKVILIENDPDTLSILGFILKDQGFEVLEFEAKISIGEIIAYSPDLIMLDYFLDDGNGGEICAALKDNPITKDIPVILLSTSLDLRLLATQSGANAFLKKPFDLREFESLIGRFVY